MQADREPQFRSCLVGLKDPMTAAAAIDRLVHHSVILELNIPGYRIEQAKKNQSKTDENEDQKGK